MSISSSSGAAAWDAGGTSITSVVGDAGLTFSVPRGTVGVVCGLSSDRGTGGGSIGTGSGVSSTEDGYEGIEFALYVSHGRVTPVESGVLITSAERDVGHMQELGVMLRGDTVAYSVGGVVFLVRPGRPLGRTYARASLFSPGDSIFNAALVRLDSQGARSDGKLHPLVAGATRGCSSEGNLLPLASTSGCDGHCRSAGALAPLTGMSAHKSYAAVIGDLHPLAGKSRAAHIIPTYCLSSSSIYPLNGVSFSATGGIISSGGELPALNGRSSDRAYAEVEGALHPLAGTVSPQRGFNHCLILTSKLSERFTLAAFSGAVFAGVAPRQPLSIVAGGRLQARNAASTLAPRCIVSAYAGAVFAGDGPSATLGIEGVFVIVGRATLAAPPATLSAQGVVWQTGGVGAHSPRATLHSFGGGTATIETAKATLSAHASVVARGGAQLLCGALNVSGFAGAVLTKNLFSQATTLATAATAAVAGVAVLTSPAAVVTASAEMAQYGSAELMMPMPWVLATPSYAVLVLPFPLLTASGASELLPWGEAWAFNLIDPPDKAGRQQQDEKYAASQYTNFPFFRIVRFGGHHYGVSATGLYRLGGETDAGEPIAWAVETTISDFGSPQLKAMPSAYVGAHLGPQARAKAVVGERGSHEYTYPNVRGAPIQNHRVVFGRGMRSRYYGVRVEDQSGGELHLDSIDLEVVTLTRKI